LWRDGPLGKELLFRKQTHGLGAPLKAVSPMCSNVHSNNNVVVVAVRTQGSIINSVLGSKVVEVMVDSGSSVRENLVTPNHKLTNPPEGIQLVSAAGEPISVLGQISTNIQPDSVKADHCFRSLITCDCRC